MGHSFCYSKVDSQRFLVPQRRNRVFGISASQGTLTQEEINAEEKQWKMVLARLGQSPHRFSLNDILEGTSLPESKLRPLDAKNLKAAQANAKRKGQDVNDICLHLGSSEDRLEFCVGACTCIRPSHDVYYAKLKRNFTGQELLRTQGVFANDFSEPKAISSMEEQLARDFAGNAFSTTVVMACLLSSMVSHSAWYRVNLGFKDLLDEHNVCFSVEILLKPWKRGHLIKVARITP